MFTTSAQLKTHSILSYRVPGVKMVHKLTVDHLHLLENNKLINDDLMGFALELVDLCNNAAILANR